MLCLKYWVYILQSRTMSPYDKYNQWHINKYYTSLFAFGWNALETILLYFVVLDFVSLKLFLKCFMVTSEKLPFRFGWGRSMEYWNNCAREWSSDLLSLWVLYLQKPMIILIITKVHNNFNELCMKHGFGMTMKFS